MQGHRGLWTILLVVGFVMPSSASAQDDDRFEIVEIRGGARRVNVRVLPVEVATSEATVRAAATALTSRLVQDLVYSGLIAIETPLPAGVRFPRYTTDAARLEDEAAIDYEVHVRVEGDTPAQMAWVGRVLVSDSKQVVLAKRYRVTPDDYARTVHHFSDTVVEEITGEVGIAQTRIIFSRGRGSQRELFLVDYDGENLRRVTRNGSLNLTPRWSPAGDRICYTSYYRGKQRLLILDGSTGKSHNVAEFGGLNIGASWAPDGKSLVVTLSHEGNPEIYRISDQGRVLQRLTFQDAIDCSPYLDPLGNQVVYTSDRTGVPQIYVMDREGANRRRLTYEGRYNDSAAWSPLGDRIAYVSRREGLFQLFTIQPDGDNVQAITVKEDRNNEDPAWAPDGRHLVVSRDRSGKRALWIINVETGEARPLTNGDEPDTTPHWSMTPSS